MKRLVATILVAVGLLVSLAPAFAEQTVTSPALPDKKIVEPNGFLSDTWFAQGVFGGGD